jgi:hypothetical protein
MGTPTPMPILTPPASTGDDNANAAKKAATDKAIFIFMASSPVMASFGL